MGKLKEKERILHRTTLYLDYELFKKLKEKAYKQDRTITELINEAIKYFVEEVLKDEGEGQKS